MLEQILRLICFANIFMPSITFNVKQLAGNCQNRRHPYGSKYPEDAVAFDLV